MWKARENLTWISLLPLNKLEIQVYFKLSQLAGILACVYQYIDPDCLVPKEFILIDETSGLWNVALWLSTKNNKKIIWQVNILIWSRHYYLKSWHNIWQVDIIVWKDNFLNDYVDLSDYFVDLSENYVDLSDNYVDLSDIQLTSWWLLVALARYRIRYLATSCVYI